MLVLASGSPRRAELLNQLQVPFRQLPMDVDESMFKNEDPQDHVVRLARKKAQAARQKAGHIDPVLGADTLVVTKNQALGKPESKADFEQMFALLSGSTHQVMTAVALYTDSGLQHRLVITQVSFKVLSKQEIDWYWQSGEPKDKAGGYGIQGLAGQFVTHIKGSYTAVVGLPLYETSELLKENQVL
ncbi:Maf family protein [Lacimicrobium alkaliphilum]|uniref:dTTP/UTP pyrophosphatase n=1 Tax=Lacimicrobium alkaliphilum TaxID=1526571 RepID=A0ABQ1RAG1_9ALTE|nr:Maf family protein [Lacimicrobium alkaliphilum]GGD61945.1 Maf-like protein [Lacimicrobium alkaliphilum]